jgi:hypothetical protein
MAAIDRWEGHWHQYSGEACLAIFSMAGRPLNPGAEYVGATGVRDPGRFRLRLGVSVAGEQVEWTGVSNAFEIQ